MRIKFHTLLCVFLMWAIPGLAVVKPHVISFGKWTTVKWLAGPIENRTLDLKVRALYVDTRLKEYTTGAPHEVTDRLFVVQRVFRLNDSLPDEGGGMPRWQWQRGGWLLVDRVTGRITPIALAEFDPLYSTASWYRDCTAYCGVSDDGKKLFAMVVQLGRRKPILRRGRLARRQATIYPTHRARRRPGSLRAQPSNRGRDRRLCFRCVDVRSTW